jgi:hypothetical protein
MRTRTLLSAIPLLAVVGLAALPAAGSSTPGATPAGVLPSAALEEADGRALGPSVSLGRWRQLYHELFHASREPLPWPSPASLRETGRPRTASGVIPLAVIDAADPRPGPDGRAESRVFAAAALKDYTHRGGDVLFRLDAERYYRDDAALPVDLAIDFADGRGFRSLLFGKSLAVRYERLGVKEVRVRAVFANGSMREAAFPFYVKALQTPVPDDTLSVTATIPYLGEFGSGEAYVYLADAHSVLTNPVVVIEGFDIEDNYDWEELYELLNKEELLETLRGYGFDAVVLNFTEATDYLQRNALVVVELIQQVNALIAPPANLALVGASMGGLLGRYALTYMEGEGIEDNVRVFISFDAPQGGASIPLGVQYWLSFFAGLSEQASFLLSRLDTPGARQMLLYHHTDPPGTTGESDSLRTAFVAELASMGSYPAGVRKVAVANGSGSRQDQGYAAGAQVIEYEYESFLVDITGNVWSVPDGSSQVIFDGLIDFILLPAEEMTVTVSGTLPYDSAPGGYRGTMAQMDTTETGYGDIVALHDNHCFIPTISALDLDVTDLFYDIAGDPNLASHTPFDAVYFPAVNEEHVSVTPQNKAWFLAEVLSGAVDVAEVSPLGTGLELGQNSPNPFRTSTSIRYWNAAPGELTLRVYDVAGRAVRTLVAGPSAAGGHRAQWDGRDDAGAPVASGIYYYRLSTRDSRESRRMLLLR